MSKSVIEISMQISFICTGIMEIWIANNTRKHSYEIVIFNRT